MSTRSTIEVRYTAGATKEIGYGDSFYKHHDGYIKGGLGELLIHFITYTKALNLDFLAKFKEFAQEQSLEIKTICTRVEKIKNQKFDFIICRAFAPLLKLLYYSRFFHKKNTSLLFLKGRSVKKEIHEAKKSFSFEYDLYPSQSEGDGYVLKINKYYKL